MRHTIFLFGEAEKGDFCTPLLCRSLSQLADHFGHPPEESLGIYYAIQALLFERDLVFFRVKEEGFSLVDYRRGLKLLQNKEVLHPLTAVCMPGVGDKEIIEAAHSVCQQRKSFLIITEKDLYDLLTHLF